MKRLTASEVRRNWFRILDEVAGGEVVVVERNGKQVILRRATRKRKALSASAQDYSRLIRVPDLDNADQWGWDWKGPGQDLVPRPRRKAE